VIVVVLGVTGRLHGSGQSVTIDGRIDLLRCGSRAHFTRFQKFIADQRKKTGSQSVHGSLQVGVPQRKPCNPERRRLSWRSFTARSLAWLEIAPSRLNEGCQHPSTCGVGVLQTIITKCGLSRQRFERRHRACDTGALAVPQWTPKAKTHHFRRVPGFARPTDKRLAGTYRRITHHFK
jgi:hypothetical protein